MTHCSREPCDDKSKKKKNRMKKTRCCYYRLREQGLLKNGEYRSRAYICFSRCIRLTSLTRTRTQQPPLMPFSWCRWCCTLGVFRDVTLFMGDGTIAKKHTRTYRYTPRRRTHVYHGDNNKKACAPLQPTPSHHNPCRAPYTPFVAGKGR